MFLIYHIPTEAGMDVPSHSIIFIVYELCLTLCDPLDCSTRPPCPLPSRSLPKFMSIALVMPSSHLILWCPLLLLPSVFPSFSVFSSELAFHIRWLNIGASTSAFPMNIQGWFPLGLNDWIALLSKGLSRVFPSTTIQKHRFFSTQPSLWS